LAEAAGRLDPTTRTDAINAAVAALESFSTPHSSWNCGLRRASVQAKLDQMSQGKKRFERMAGNPKGDWRIEDIEVAAEAHGCTCDPPSGGGSHYTVSRPGVAEILTIPARKPIKPVYIRLFVDYIKRHAAEAKDGAP